MNWRKTGVATSALLGRTGITGSARCDPNIGSCYFSYFNLPFWFNNYNVIDTDYDNYSIVYYCNRQTQL